MRRKFVVGSGWWCADPKGTTGKEKGHPKFGHPFIRSLAFHEVWRYFIHKYTAPYRIVIVDSASPYKPPAESDEEWITLDKNYQSLQTKYNGWLRGIMVGAQYAWACASDFIYVEQDCVVLGKGWVDKIYEQSDGTHAMYGGVAWRGAKKLKSWTIQQSLVFLPCDIIPRFLFFLTQFKDKMACEQMFIRMGKKVPYQTLPFGYGRIRPVNFQEEHFYIQHMSAAELYAIAKREDYKRLYGKLEAYEEM